MAAPTQPTRVDLLWIPLGAGGAATVRVCGRIYETVKALAEMRRPLDLYHTALEVRLVGGRYIIESAWPSPDSDTSSRGVVVEGPVLSPRLGRLRVFTYEVRCWREGTIPDAGAAVVRHTLTNDPLATKRLLGLAASVPDHSWGRRLTRTGEMWNSNSVISYLLSVGGLPADRFLPPAGGRAPGWATGIIRATDLGHRRPPSQAMPSVNVRF
jgi:hypothetical protein